LKTTLIIARHGNTFKKEETPTRAGASTDLALVEKAKARAIGSCLKANNLMPDIIFASPLIRTIQTAVYAMEEAGLDQYPLTITNLFKEIDYGPDENKIEKDVELRLGRHSLATNKSDHNEDQIREEGKKVIELWNSKAVVPHGWNVSPKAMIEGWKNFASDIEKSYKNKVVLVVTSNGVARFSPHITASFEDFSANNNLKISTGSICIFEKSDENTYWDNIAWNLKPSL
jgi:probable phosphoglycerate mutase